MTDALTRLEAARSELLEEREAILERLASIDEAIGAQSAPMTRPRPRSERPAGVLQAAIQSAPPLVRAVLQITRRAPMSAETILERLQANQFTFTSSSPLEELTTALKGSGDIKDYGGKFGPSFGRPR